MVNINPNEPNTLHLDTRSFCFELSHKLKEWKETLNASTVVNDKMDECRKRTGCFCTACPMHDVCLLLASSARYNHKLSVIESDITLFVSANALPLFAALGAKRPEIKDFLDFRKEEDIKAFGELSQALESYFKQYNNERN